MATLALLAAVIVVPPVVLAPKALAAGNAGYTTFDSTVGGCVHGSYRDDNNRALKVARPPVT